MNKSTLKSLNNHDIDMVSVGKKCTCYHKHGNELVFQVYQHDPYSTIEKVCKDRCCFFTKDITHYKPEGAREKESCKATCCF